MRERPILFSAPMVRAILAGTKTQTRRVLKQATGPSLSVGIEDDAGVAELSWLWGDGPGHEVHEMIKKVPCPYGKPSDRLWVRETWGFNPDFPDMPGRACFRADPGHEYDGIRWRPSIHMPRAASRLSLEITGVRVERLQDISEADAMAEGVEFIDLPTGRAFLNYDSSTKTARNFTFTSAVDSYRTLWTAINGTGSWDANSWAWVVEFRRDSKEGAA
jgi:hypothetical protein